MYACPGWLLGSETYNPRRVKYANTVKRLMSRTAMVPSRFDILSLHSARMCVYVSGRRERLRERDSNRGRNRERDGAVSRPSLCYV